MVFACRRVPVEGDNLVITNLGTWTHNVMAIQRPPEGVLGRTVARH